MKVVKLDLDAGGKMIAVLNESFARKLGINAGDRVLLRFDNGKEVIAIVDLSKKFLHENEVGILRDIWEKVDSVEEVEVFPISKPKSLSYIKKRLLGKELMPKEIEEIVRDFLSNKLSDAEAAYFVASSYVKGFSEREKVALARAIYSFGKRLSFERHPVLDKHCIGGVPGNRTTPIIVPIVAAAGYLIPKTSSRAITSPAGTADVVEIFANVELGAEKLKEVVEKTNGAMVWGGGVDLAPADDKLIKLRYSLRLDPRAFLLASILAKKKAAGADKVIIDIPLGAKVKSMEDAKDLAIDFKRIGKRIGLDVDVVITEGSQPIGRGIGPVLEARDVLLVLKNSKEAPQDLKEKALYLSSRLLRLAGEEEPFEKARKILESGRAFRKFVEIIEAQGKKIEPSLKNLKPGEYVVEYRAKKEMARVYYDSKGLSQIARIAGNPGVKEAGILLHVKPGESAGKGDLLFEVFTINEYRAKLVEEYLRAHEIAYEKKLVLFSL